MVNSGEDEMKDKIIELLKEYRCQYIEDDELNGLPLVDVLTPPDEDNITLGVREIELLADYLAEGCASTVEKL